MRKPITAADSMPETLSDKDRDMIHGVARMERALHRVQPGDRIEAETQFRGGVLGTVTKVSPGWPDNSGLSDPLVVTVDPDDPELERQDVSVDYEGAFTSYFPYYLPYVVAGSGYSSYGELVSLWINGKAVAVDVHDFDVDE